MPRKRLVTVLAWAALFCILAAAFVSELRLRREQADRERDRAMNETIRIAAPLISAISQFELKNHKPPDSLKDLVPQFITSLPAPAAAHERAWYYETRLDGDPVRGRWVLGIRVRDDLSPQSWGFGDYLVYEPRGRYEETGYGGSLWKRYGDWAYYVE